jgi:hypothetical protein
MVHMRSGEGTPTMSRSRLVERPEKGCGLVGRPLASAQRVYLLILEGSAFAVKGALSNGRNTLLQALFTIQPKDRYGSWTTR